MDIYANVDVTRKKPGMERTSVTLPRDLARRLSAEASGSGRSVSAVVRDALIEYLAAREEPELPSFTGVGDSGREDVSERIEDLIEEEVRRAAR